MFAQIKKNVKQIMKSIKFKFLIVFLVAMIITIVLGLNFYAFWIVVFGFLAGVFSIFVTIVEQIVKIMQYEIPPFLKNLPINIKKGTLIFFWGVFCGTVVVALYVQIKEKNNFITENKEGETYQINVLNEIPSNVNVGESVSIDLNIITPDSYKFETTPFILYSAYFDEEKWEWEQMSALYLSAGEENYSVKIDTNLLGLSEGRYMIAFDLFKSSDYSEGRGLASERILLNLSGESTYYDDDIFDRNVITYEKITDVFVINGVAYRYDSEELVLSNIKNDDLEKISRCQQLKSLQITGDDLTDLEPLSHMYSLESLHISSNNLEDITPIGELINLKNLSIGGSEYNGMGFSGKLSDITPIENLINLESLSISDCQIEDIGAVRKLSKLTLLWIYKTPVRDISPLKELVMLEDLRLHSNNISDISVLENLKELEYLTLSGNPIVLEQLDRLQKEIPDCDILYR